jgi:hypothetical protein
VSRLTRRPRLVLMVLGVLTLLLLSETLVLAAGTLRTGDSVRAVDVTTGPGSTTKSTSWVSVDGMSLTMTVPSNQKGLFLAAFSAMAQEQLSEGICDVAMTVNGSWMAPASVTFDSGDTAARTHTKQFVAGPLPPGAYTFNVLFSVPFGECIPSYPILSVLRAQV